MRLLRPTHAMDEKRWGHDVVCLVPKSRGGSDRVSNLTLACRTCNQAKGNRTAEEFGYAEVQAKAMQPLKDAAAVNATRHAIRDGLSEMGFVVRSWTGRRTKYNRIRFGIPKTHALDALCVGDIVGVSDWNAPVLKIKALSTRTAVSDERGRARFPTRIPDASQNGARITPGLAVAA